MNCSMSAGLLTSRSDRSCESSQAHEERLGGRRLSRAAKLMSVSLPHVVTPREIGLLDNGDGYLVTDDLPYSVWRDVDGKKGLSPDGVLAMVEQIVVGLAGLHQHKIYHGGLRTQRLLLDRPPGGRNDGILWIADACIGCLPFWAEGAFTDPEGHKYYPPDWQGKANEPTASADLYALGVSVAEILESARVIPQRRGRATEMQEIGWTAKQYSWRELAPIESVCPRFLYALGERKEPGPARTGAIAPVPAAGRGR